ncbi:prion-like-(Q/N-rich) domain-bearing protein 25 [Anabrus simplex]|uniref:prion-like-(Q/N-rich) domain-bearing protein 25 n=1 Tax=Anabrus simplex TaxID=316456 RepID=UPI0035A2C6F4
MNFSTSVILVFLLTLARVHYGSAGQLGSSCYYDAECDSITTFCRNRQTCDCKDNFRREGNLCYATAGARCDSNNECSSLPNSECKENICVCTAGYVSHPTTKVCLAESGYINDNCEIDEQCSKKFGPFAGCIERLCKCRDSYHFHINWCFPNTGLTQACRNDSYCYLSENERHKIRCLDGTCKCSGNFRMSDNTCVDSASIPHVSIATVLLYLAARFLL